jgi:hypothetical protein
MSCLLFLVYIYLQNITSDVMKTEEKVHRGKQDRISNDNLNG